MSFVRAANRLALGETASRLLQQRLFRGSDTHEVQVGINVQQLRPGERVVILVFIDVQNPDHCITGNKKDLIE